jgi:hypothetical protein
MSMDQYYNVKTKLETEIEGAKGVPKIKVITEQYLISAISPTDAEAKMTKHLSGLMSEFEVTSISLTKIVDVVA